MSPPGPVKISQAPVHCHTVSAFEVPGFPVPVIKESILRSKTRASVPEKSVSKLGDVCEWSEFPVWSKSRISVRVPFQTLTTDKNTADGIAASIDIFGRGMNHNVSSKLQWLDQIPGLPPCCLRSAVRHAYVPLPQLPGYR